MYEGFKQLLSFFKREGCLVVGGWVWEAKNEPKIAKNDHQKEKFLKK